LEINETIFCLPLTCNWIGINNLLWSKQLPQLSIKDAVYYYPTELNNSINYVKNNFDINSKDLCFTIGYWASKKVTLHIRYKTLYDNSESTLLSIKPKLNASQLETFKFCLKDFVALYSQDFTISFVANNSNSVKDGINKFVFTVLNEIVINRSIIKNQKLYLHKWQINFKNISEEWVTAIPENIFSFTGNDAIIFNGKYISINFKNLKIFLK
jgi:hypothetical protein